MIVTDYRVARFVGERVDTILEAPFTAIGLDVDGEIVAGAVFNVFTGHDVHVTVAAMPGRITRQFVKACGDYVFRQMVLERATFVTEQPLVIDLAKRCGAVQEGLLRNHFGCGRDAVVLGVLRDDWRF